MARVVPGGGAGVPPGGVALLAFALVLGCAQKPEGGPAQGAAASQTLESFEADLTAGRFEEATSLDLRGRGWGPEVARVVAASPRLGKLTSLDLSGNGIGDEGARALASGSVLSRL